MIAHWLVGIQLSLLLSPHDRFLIAESLAPYGIQTSEIKSSQIAYTKLFRLTFHLASGNNCIYLSKFDFSSSKQFLLSFRLDKSHQKPLIQHFEDLVSSETMSKVFFFAAGEALAKNILQRRIYPCQDPLFFSIFFPDKTKKEMWWDSHSRKTKRMPPSKFREASMMQNESFNSNDRVQETGDLSHSEILVFL